MSDKKPKGKPLQIIIHEPPSPRLEDVDPCAAGLHKPAWLNSGRVACGRCGVPL